MTMTYSMEELLPLLEKQIRRYTMGDSTSVPYDKARQLMGSIIYNIEGAFEEDVMLVSTEGISPQQAFELGLKKKKEKFKKAEELYREIRNGFCSYGNQCYMETVIKGMKAFFDYYSLEFDALNIIITLDYPLIGKGIGLQGVDLIYEYLKKIELEQLFLRGFDGEMVERMLSAYDREYRDGILNVCSVALRNSVGMVLAGAPSPFGIMNENALERIMPKVLGKTPKEIRSILEDALRRIIDNGYGKNARLYEYLHGDIADLAIEIERVANSGSLEAVFPIYREREEILEWYESSPPMKDEDLRILIDEIRSCDFTEDKLSIVKQEIRSLDDFKEVMEECFEEHEYSLALSLLSSEEVKKLREEILLKQLFGDELKEWEKHIV